MLTVALGLPDVLSLRPMVTVPPVWVIAPFTTIEVTALFVMVEATLELFGTVSEPLLLIVMVLGNNMLPVMVTLLAIATFRPACPSISVRPFVTVQFWSATVVTAGAIHKFAVALLKLMPELPREITGLLLVSSFTAATGLEIKMPPQFTEALKVFVQLAGVAKVASHTATLPEPGAAPPTQLVPRLRASLLFVL